MWPDTREVVALNYQTKFLAIIYINPAFLRKCLYGCKKTSIRKPLVIAPMVAAALSLKAE
jgi:hypothetical protein